MVWISTTERDCKAIQELTSLPDRAAAIVAGALLDQRLETALRETLRDANLSGGQSIQDRMFDLRGALGSFAVKIDLGFMVGLYGAGARADMALINKVRNRFAHDLDVGAFSAVRDLCANLSEFEKHFFEYGKEPPPGLVSWIVAESDLHAHLLDPRQRFMMAVRLYYSALLIRSTPPGI
jgi:hypothetical protein